MSYGLKDLTETNRVVDIVNGDGVLRWGVNLRYIYLMYIQGIHSSIKLNSKLVYLQVSCITIILKWANTT